MTNLPQRIRQQTLSANLAGALNRVTTEMHRVQDSGVHWVVHELGWIHRKLAFTDSQRLHGDDPFRTPEADLLIGRISPTHLVVLNKFPVLDAHILITTERFEYQYDPLSHQDFEAVQRCLDELDGLAFFNSSVVAGASQLHKHLQLVPLPIGFGPGRTPIEHLLERVPRGEVGHVPELDFAHQVQVCGDPPSWIDGEQIQRVFWALFDAVSRGRSEQPFNLLLTRRWMMVVPRRRECFEGISVNALGFVGSLLVRDRSQLGRVREVGPLTVLSAVAGVGGQD